MYLNFILSLLLSQNLFALSKRTLESPQVFLLKQTNRALAEGRSVPPRTTKSIEVNSGTSKTEWLATLYSNHVIDQSKYSLYLSDKLLMSAIFEKILGENTTQQYLPKTLGLRQFLERNQLVDRSGNIKADGDKIDSALHDEFPTGFFVRPAVGVTPYENENGMFDRQEELTVELLKGKTPLYDPSTYWLPIKSHILNEVASGEAVVLQENLVLSADLRGKLKRRGTTLVRVHTYENKVIPDSVPKRWVVDNAEDHLTDQQIKGATEFAQKFLDQLPEDLIHKQAWSIEVAGFDNGTYRIANILTNRGRSLPWSTYLDQPRILKAYTDFFESNGDLQFEGLSAKIIRFGFANYFTYWKLRFQKAQGWRKIIAAFPPLP